MPQAEYLLIDISNSFTKLLLAGRDALLAEEPVRIPTAELSPEALRQVAHPQDFRMAVLSSVVPEAENAVRTFAAGCPLLKINGKTELGIEIDYPEPESIGADRLANAAAAAAFYGAPVVVVDFGTAVTFDVLAVGKNGPAYVGGVIAPGLEAMTDYLYQRTALLPRIDLREPSCVIGKSTRQAMLSGAIHGYRGLVREILAGLRQELGAEIETVATGGYAELIAQRLPEIHRVHPNLTLEGLRIAGEWNR